MKDPRTEAWLSREGVAFEYLDQLPLALIDEAKSQANQARVEALDPGLVKDYETLIEAGTQFPPIVVYLVNSSKYVIIDGNHRYTAYKNKDVARSDAYLVKTSDRFILERLTRAANQTNGKRASENEVLQSALQLVERYGRTVAEVAASFGIPPSRLHSLVRTSATRNRLRAMNQPREADRLLGTTAAILATIDNDRVLKEAAIATVEGGMTGAQVTELIHDIAAGRTEMDQLMAVKRFTERPDYTRRKEETQGGRVRTSTMPQSHAVVTAMGALKSALKKRPTREQLGLTDDTELTRLQGEWVEIKAIMEQVLYGNTTGIEAGNQGVNGRRAATFAR
jgi:hypothetical protein